MTTIRRIVTSKIDGNQANENDTNEIRPFGETAFYLDTDQNPDALTLMMFDGTRTHVRSKILRPGVFYGSNENSSDGNGFDTIKLIPDSFLDWDSEYQNDQYIVIEPTGGEPGHIHVRAGGPIDLSTADLFLGGEINHVKVSDTNSAVNINSSTNAFISIGNPLVSGVDVDTVDELIPPGDVWRLFIDSNIYPALGVSVQIGGTVTTGWGNTAITATITDIQQDNNTDRWVIHVDQDITEGFDAGPKTVSFDSSYKTWAFGQNGNLQFPGSSNGRIGEDEPGLVVYSDLSFGIITNVANTENSKAWIFTNDNRLILPSNSAITSPGEMRLRTTRAGFDIDTDFDVEAADDVWIDALGNDARLAAANVVRIRSGTSVMYPTIWEGEEEDFIGTWDGNTLTVVTSNGLGTLVTLLDHYTTSDAPIWIKTASGYIETENSESATKTVGETITTFEIPTLATSPAENASVLKLKLYDSINSLGEGGHTWTFEKNGKLSFPNGGAIEPVGMGWMGVTNGTSGNPVSVMNKNMDGDQRSSVSLYNSDTYGTAEIITINAPGIANGLSNWDGAAGGWNENLYTNHPTTGGTGTGLTVDVAANGAGYINIGAITINNPGTGYTAGDVITIENENNLSGTFTISVPEQINVWTFEEDGNFTFTGGASISGNIEGTSHFGLTTPANTNFTVITNAGDHRWVFGADGNLILPEGGTISEGIVTNNPTIELVPPRPDAVSQKLVVKGGGVYNVNNNGINLNYYQNTAIVGDTLTFYVNSETYANQTLYWWIHPSVAGISDPGFGTVTLDGGPAGTFTFTVDSDDYEFTVRVSPTNNYDPATVGVESMLINAAAPTFSEYHLHLTTGDLTETSIFLGTDDHNARTTIDGKIQITTPNEINNVWEFDTDATLTLPSVVWNYEPVTYTSIPVTYGATELTFTVLPDNTITNMIVAVGAGGYGPNTFNLTVPGTTFPGGASPANDIVFNVQTFESAGPVYSTDPASEVIYVSGTPPQRYDNISSIGGISVGTGAGANTHHWTFGDTGITTLPGSIIGRAKTNTYVDTIIELDVTATINKIVPTTSTGGDKYNLADGVEGQIMYLVPATGGEQSVEYTEMSFDHARYTNGAGVINEGSSVGGWLPFQNLNTSSVILTLIFTDGHWNLPHNIFD